MKNKVICDIVHGYIEINEIERQIIDLPIFQRLARIRQGLNNAAFPNCTHTRFEHSLGVMHLGSKILENITYKEESPELKDKLSNLQQTTRIACLLHDIGHAPFSHIGEFFFEKKSLVRQLCAIRGEAFRAAFENAHAHELMSALIVYKDSKISAILEANRINKSLVADMICGNAHPYRNSIEFVLIQILYSQIDADRLDYILRDNKMAGGTFASLDTNRLIAAYLIKKNRLRLDYRAQSTIGNFMTGRSNIYMWVLNHHRNILNNGLHYEFIKQLIDDEKVIKKEDFFSYNAITQGFVDDYDLISKFKKFRYHNETTKICYTHIFERGDFSPIWKTGMECDLIFEKVDPSQRDFIYGLIDKDTPRATKIEDLIRKQCENIKGPFFVFHCRDKHYEPLSISTMERDAVYIIMRSGIESRFDKVFPSAPVKTYPIYFYVYFPKNYPHLRELKSIFKVDLA